MRRREFLGAAVIVCAPAAFSQEAPSVWDKTFDVVVVGGGGAGLSAALSAAESGARVLLIEKEAFIGGDTLISGGYFDAAGTPLQNRLGIEDSRELYEEQMLLSADGRSDPKLAAALAAKSEETWEWLKRHGVKFEDRVYQIYGAMHRRSHKALLPRGSGYIKALSEACLEKGVVIRTSCTLQKIIREAGRVTGILASLKGGENIAVRARRGVVLAAGGFGANPKMISQYSPRHAALQADSARGGTGEALRLAREVGASVSNMDSIETVPEGSPSPGLSVRIYTVINGLVFVNAEGRRFIDENSPRKALAEAILREGSGSCFTIADSANVASLDKMQIKNLYRSMFSGLAWRADTLEELAEKTGLDPENLRQSVAEVASHLRPSKPPFWAVRMHLWIHYTLGGLRINEHAACLDDAGRVIDGLFAAGQITGNVHGANRLGGNGLTDAVVFGRIAGESAAKNR
jgi:flavocytochrome c